MGKLENTVPNGYLSEFWPVDKRQKMKVVVSTIQNGIDEVERVRIWNNSVASKIAMIAGKKMQSYIKFVIIFIFS